ncbi:MAG: helix-turn-helix transcriptional regulator, partial [Micromonosporaceae bacterium]
LVQVIDDSPPRYAAKVAPDTAAEMLTRRTRVHRQRIAAAAAARCRVPVRPSIGGAPEVLAGPDEIRRVNDALQRNARREVLCVDKPPYVDCNAINLIERDQLVNGVTYRVVYDRSALSARGRLDTISELVEIGEQARTASGVPMKMMIFDRAAAVIPLQISAHTIERALLVRHSSLVGALAKVFADLWHGAVPFGPGRTPVKPVTATEPSTEERQILALLSAGSTDETIGRLMNFSPRTAHRRVRELTAKLGVETRFQAGVQAVRLGWL